MRVKDETLKLVAFLAFEDSRGQRTVVGTCFFLVYPIEGVPVNALHAVTARHVIEAIAARGSNGIVWIKLNTSDGAEEGWIQTDASAWFFHSDDRIDVALWVTSNAFDNYDVRPLPLKGVATQDFLDRHDVGIGDELMFPGLYVRRQGETSNIPILRMGTIASMSKHPVITKMGMMPAYLCEARSIGGLSGSPVFVRIPAERNPGGPGIVSLIGLIHGHINSEHVQEPQADSFFQSSEKINSGIAVVVPSEFVLQSLELEGCVAYRREMKERYLKMLES